MNEPSQATSLCRVQVVYSGQVQGVGFRATAESIARRFAVTGWVRNEANGKVRLEAQGEQAEVEGFLGEIRRRQARLLAGVDVIDIPVNPAEATFEIARTASHW